MSNTRTHSEDEFLADLRRNRQQVRRMRQSRTAIEIITEVASSYQALGKKLLVQQRALQEALNYLDETLTEEEAKAYRNTFTKLKVKKDSVKTAETTPRRQQPQSPSVAIVPRPTTLPCPPLVHIKTEPVSAKPKTALCLKCKDIEVTNNFLYFIEDIIDQDKTQRAIDNQERKGDQSHFRNCNWIISWKGKKEFKPTFIPKDMEYLVFAPEYTTMIDPKGKEEKLFHWEIFVAMKTTRAKTIKAFTRYINNMWNGGSNGTQKISTNMTKGSAKNIRQFVIGPYEKEWFGCTKHKPINEDTEEYGIVPMDTGKKRSHAIAAAREAKEAESKRQRSTEQTI